MKNVINFILLIKIIYILINSFSLYYYDNASLNIIYNNIFSSSLIFNYILVFILFNLSGKPQTLIEKWVINMFLLVNGIFIILNIDM